MLKLMEGLRAVSLSPCHCLHVEPGCYVIPLSLSGDELLSVDTTPRSRGWSAYFSTVVAQADAEVLLRLALTDFAGAGQRPNRPSALQVGELRVLVGQRAPGFVSSLLREIPVLRIEAAINQTVAGAPRRECTRRVQPRHRPEARR